MQLGQMKRLGGRYVGPADGSAAAADSLQRCAKGEAILNRTLAYHAAMAVAEINDTLGITIREMRLVVAETRNRGFEVTCSLESAAPQQSVETQTEVTPVAHRVKGDAGLPNDPRPAVSDPTAGTRSP